MSKREKGVLNGTPVKRMFWSIISDYELNTALCELVDNAVDNWWPAHETKKLNVAIELDAERQLIFIEDDAGGVAEADLEKLVAPGSSTTAPGGETIGVFGVGSKRAAIALAENVSIRTRQEGDETYQIDITRDWVESDSWEIRYHEAAQIPTNSTRIEMSALRSPISDDSIQEITDKLGAIYAKFLATGNMLLSVNGVPIEGIEFDRWAYPKKQSPQRIVFDVHVPDGDVVQVRITCGLVFDRDAELDNYGVYFYCNRRLVVQDLKAREVGYFSGGGGAGVPHPDASLARAIVELMGPAEAMPWTSNKAGVNFSHTVFREVRDSLIPLLSHFSSLSRRLKDRWATDVLSRRTGNVIETRASDVTARRIHLPELPKINRSRSEQLVARNKAQLEKQPWGLGLVEAVAATDFLIRQRFETKNRIALILLDSNFEIALKEYIVHQPKLFPANTFTDAEIARRFGKRHEVVREVAERAGIGAELVERAQHFYLMRNKLTHERATVDVTESDVRNYRQVLQQVLMILFGLNIGPG